MPSTKVTGGFKQKVNSSKPRRGFSLVWNFCLTVPRPAIALGQSKGRTVFIVQAKPREPEGIVKVTKDTRKDALATANNFLKQGFPFVTIVADGRVYTVDEFATTIVNGEPPPT
jgi:hypothetical protein